jgi:hypothetical protein
MIGEALGNYTITAKLGSGTMEGVFRAEHVRIARTAAIKVLVPELAQNAVVAIAGVSALAVTVWNASRSNRRPGDDRPPEAAVLPGTPEIAHETGLPPRAIVVSARSAARIPTTGVMPPPRQPARKGERSQRPARSARRGAATQKQVGNTDGIVDL